MKILFYIKSLPQARLYKNMFLVFAARGYRTRVVFDRRKKKSTIVSDIIRFQNECGGEVSFEFCFGFLRGGMLKRFLFAARELRTYRRYLLVRRCDEYFTKRWVAFFPKILRVFAEYMPVIFNAALRTDSAGRFLRFIERAAHPEKKIIQQILEFKPDAVLVAYRNLPSSSPDLEYLKAAKRLGIPTVIPVMGWDTFTTKGLIQVIPDRILVWNEEQVSELLEFHGIQHTHARVVGAYQFDDLSVRTPSQTRRAFCAAHGLTEKYPILLYLGLSSREVDTRLPGGYKAIVEEICKALANASDPRVRTMQIVVRPHPNRPDEYQRGALGNSTIAIVPEKGMPMTDNSAVQLFYDSVFFAACVAAVNTTAIIDAAVIGKPGIVLHFGKYLGVQSAGYFKRFLNSGAVAVAETPQSFVEEIVAILDGNDRFKNGREQYISSFLRPRGGARLPSEYAADEIESLVAL